MRTRADSNHDNTAEIFQERHVIIKSFNRDSDLRDDVNGFYGYQGYA